MGLHTVCADEAEHVDARGGVDGLAGVAADGFAAQDAAREVDDLQGGLARVADDPLAAVEVGEGVAGFVLGDGARAKHQAETALVVAGGGVEGVARCGQQVNVVARHVVDEVEVVHLHAFGGDGEGVLSIGVGAEVDRHFALAFGADDGEVLTVLRDVELGGIGVEGELLQAAARVEVDDGVVVHHACGSATAHHLLRHGHLQLVGLRGLLGSRLHASKGNNLIFGRNLHHCTCTRIENNFRCFGFQPTAVDSIIQRNSDYQREP